MPENLDANRRVVVTGLGLICAVGVGLKQCWSRLLAGEGGVRRITRFDPEGFESQIAAEVQGFDPLDYMERKEARRMDRFAQFAVAAAREALQSATLAISPRDSERVGVIIGSAMGGMGALEDAYATLHSRGPSRVSPFFVPMMLADLAAGQVSILLGARGPNWAPVSACATGAHAIGEAAAIIRRGDADVILAGGAEAPITPASVAGYASMGALSRHNAHPERASRPFGSPCRWRRRSDARNRRGRPHRPSGRRGRPPGRTSCSEKVRWSNSTTLHARPRR